MADANMINLLHAVKRLEDKLDRLIDALAQELEESVTPQKDLHGNDYPRERNQDMPL